LLELFETYLLLGALVAAAACVGFLLFYFAVYKKKIKGEKTLSPWKLMLWGAFICYIVVIAGAVILSRSAGAYFWVDVHPFSAYREAYFRASGAGWREIILNIAMFVPLGFMLPLLSEKLRSLPKVFGIGLAGTLLIESLQYAAKLGVFQLDDMINNTLGAVIGYGIVMAMMTVRKSPLRALGYLAPLFVAVAAFSGIFVIYDMQEFGTLPYANYYFRVNMKNVELSNSADLSGDGGSALIYSAASIGRAEADAFAQGLFAKMMGAGAAMPPGVDAGAAALPGASAASAASLLPSAGATAAAPPDAADAAALGELLEAMDADSSGVRYQTKGGGAALRVNFRGATWEYRDTSRWEQELGFGLSEPEMRALLDRLGIGVPEAAEFSANDTEGYKFTAKMLDGDDGLVNGTLVCGIAADGGIKFIRKNMIAYGPVRPAELISPAQAYEKIESGRFNCMRRASPKSVDVESVWLDYSLDTKGYFQPVYRFKAHIDGAAGYILIRALPE
jgi:glycopeptide antibiotics resistance protein